MSPEELIGMGFSEELVVLIISALPIIELRGAIPIAINTFDMSWQSAFVLAFIGNMLPVPFILILLRKTDVWLGRFPRFRRWLDWLYKRTRKRGAIVDKYKRIGLVLFVAIPLPVTGAWTGSISAVLFGIKFWHALLAISVGVIIAGVIVTILSILGWAGALIAGLALAGLAIYSFWRMPD